MIRAICLLLSLATAGFAQFGFGIVGGAPLTDGWNVATQPTSLLTTSRPNYVIGGYAEIRLPFKLAVEADALTSHSEWSESYPNFYDATTSARSWEFPILGKYRFGGGAFRPFVGGGPTFRKLTSLSKTITNVVAGPAPRPPVSDPAIVDDTNKGIVFTGGLEFKILFLRLSPEIRYTRWTSNNVASGISDLVSTKQNQWQFLISLGF